MELVVGGRRLLWSPYLHYLCWPLLVVAMLSRFKNALYSVVSNIETLDKAAENEAEKSRLPFKFPYSRPHFLQLAGDDEVQLTGDHQIRPIIVPRDVTKIPWYSGYAEAVNAGKSARNEDQARIHIGFLERRRHRDDPVEASAEFRTPPSSPQKEFNGPVATARTNGVPYIYFAMFDGHAGTGAAISAANELHHIVHVFFTQKLSKLHFYL